MSDRPEKSPDITRRAALKSLAMGLAALPLVSVLSGCDDASQTQAPGDTDPMADVADARDTTDTTDTTDAPDVPVEVPWAIGGTAAMTATADYPNPFTSGMDAPTCDLDCQLTLGPCYAPTAPVQQDVSEGEPGIPMRLMLRVVEAVTCSPVEGAEVEIWYCNLDGAYSGDDANSVAFCTGGDERAEAAYFGRGRAIADADGVVTFDGTFPGWYPGRALHVHFLVRRGEFAGGVQDTEAVSVSQVFFPEELTAEIFDEIEGYTDRGQPDTTLSNDGVTRNVDDISPYVVGTQKMIDGAMLAWKTVSISDDETC